ncbi:MAG: response regulator [Deltaproteobacteria bacterium]|nr:response regulator [Deltaproteobacteria bacterium]
MSVSSKAKILFVDDEPKVLMAIKRVLHKHFSIDTAESGKEGLEKIKSRGPYAVVVADLRMPIMDGIQFLTRVKEIAPDTVRIMLTGYADLDTAIEAVNCGNVFRFLTKPCPNETLINALKDGVRQYNLIIAERELLEKTLRGCVALLTDLLFLSNMEASERANRATKFAVLIAQELGIKNPWKVETAGMLSQLGCLLLPEETILRFYKGEPLEGEEKQIMEIHPSVTARLINKIPRMDEIAKIIAYQEKHYDGSGHPIDEIKGDDIPLEARILKVALDLELLLGKGHSAPEAYAIMMGRKGVYDPKVLTACGKVVEFLTNYEQREVLVEELQEGMVTAANVLSRDGRLLLKQGHELNKVSIQRLRNFASTVGIVEPIAVFVSKDTKV